MAHDETSPQNGTPQPPHDAIRTGDSPEALAAAFLDNLYYRQGRTPGIATLNDLHQAAAYAVRDRLLHRWVDIQQQASAAGCKMVCYLSAEFSIGPQLGNHLLNLGLDRAMAEAIATTRLQSEDLPAVRRQLEQRGESDRPFTLRLEPLLEEETEPGLGQGGQGRLAAGIMDALASLDIPAIGYGIRYEFGLFDRRLQHGAPQEVTGDWLKFGNPWEIAHPELAVTVGFGGRIKTGKEADGQPRSRWMPAEVVEGVPYDMPISGYRSRICNTLRLWSARVAYPVDAPAPKADGQAAATAACDALTKAPYLDEESPGGKELRLKQQYFLVACALQDMLRRHRLAGGTPETFDSRFAAQLNDTHPVLAIAELMRLLVDEHGLDWELAFAVTRRTFAYTSHTRLPEALQKWPVSLLQRVLPRHLDIIFAINNTFLDQVRRRFPGDVARISRMSLIEESGERFVRMAYLACAGSHAVNGLTGRHSALLRNGLLRDFHEFDPEQFHSIPHGVTPRRFVAQFNPRLAGLLDATLGEGWLTGMDRLRELEAHAGDADFRLAWRRVKVMNKAALARQIHRRTGIRVDPLSLFDIQANRIHEDQRQPLNLLHIITRYLRLQRQPGLDLPPRTYVFSGQAAPGDAMAGLIIKLIGAVAALVNEDVDLAGRIRVVFLPDGNARNSRWLYPAADLSEQIAMAGTEASDTGNMPFTMNGALTIGTLDGANAEIREAVGPEHFLLFGMNAEEAERTWREGYRPGDVVAGNAELREVLELIAAGHFSDGDREVFRPLTDSLLRQDSFRVLADYAAYMACQDYIDSIWRDSDQWVRMAILNTAGSGRFSSDRAVREYAAKIWQARPLGEDAESPAP